MANIVNLKNYHRFDAKASMVHMQMLKARVEDMKLADLKREATVNEVSIEKTISNERQ